jgi:hypothetical protein
MCGKGAGVMCSGLGVSALQMLGAEVAEPKAFKFGAFTGIGT